MNKKEQEVTFPAPREMLKIILEMRKLWWGEGEISTFVFLSSFHSEIPALLKTEAEMCQGCILGLGKCSEVASSSSNKGGGLKLKIRQYSSQVDPLTEGHYFQ